MGFDRLTPVANLRQAAFDQLQRGKFRAKDAQVVRVWRNGRREGLKHPFRKECRFDSDHPHQLFQICRTRRRREIRRFSFRVRRGSVSPQAVQVG